jgi:exosortase A
MTTSPRAFDVPNRWRGPLSGLLVLLVAILTLYSQTARGMVAIWSVSDTYAHGFVVPFISLWLIWRIRHSLAAYVPRPSPSAWILMLGAACLWLAGDLVAVNAVTHLSLVLLLVLAVPAILGWSVTLAMAFPLGFLFFAVPIGDFMLPQLMEWTADFTIWALRLSGIPVYREGLQFIIPSGAWSVVEACSGIRYMIASVTVGCLFAYLSYSSIKKRLVFLGVAILVPLVANWMRAYMIVMIGHLSGNELATGVDHLIYGWVFFGVVILIMLFIGARWADTPALPAGPLPLVASPEPAPKGRSSAIAVVAGLLIVASPHLLERLLAISINTDAVALSEPAIQAPWQKATTTPSDWAPAFKFSSDTRHLGFTGPQGEAVGLHLSYYRDQDYERKLVTSVNVLVTSDDKRWSQVSVSSAAAQLAGRPLTVATAILRNQAGGLAANSQRLQVWRFYWVNNRFTASDAMAKIQGALSRITGQGDDGAIVVIYTPLDPQLNDADARAAATAVLQNFMQSQGGAIEAALKTTRGAP